MVMTEVGMLIYFHLTIPNVGCVILTYCHSERGYMIHYVIVWPIRRKRMGYVYILIGCFMRSMERHSNFGHYHPKNGGSWVCPSIQQRVRTFCFEDLVTSQTKSSTVDALIGFLTDNMTTTSATMIKDNDDSISSAADEEDEVSNQKSREGKYDGGHATSHDPTLRQRLFKIIEQIDREYYNNDIAWLHSIVPCR